MRLTQVAWTVVVLGCLTAVCSAVISGVGPDLGYLFGSSVLFTVAAAAVAGSLQHRQNELERKRQEEVDHQRQAQQPLDTLTLDQDCADLVRRADAAMKTILTSEANAEDLLDPPVDEQLLREHVEAISAAGQKITALRAGHRSITAGSSRICDICGGRGEVTEETHSFIGPVAVTKVCAACGGNGQSSAEVMPGPMTTAVLEPQRQALAMALQSATSRVEDLERYAESVKAVDATYTDWIRAQEAERLNDQVRDLLAETVKDRLAAEEFKKLTEKAAIAEQALRQSIHEAHLAAETLALPGDEGS